jgi:S1-C subfamily serine protease
MTVTTSASEETSALVDLSNSLAGAVERVGQSVVAVKARGRVPSSGVFWQQGIIVTADHTVERDDNISITLPNGNDLKATIAGRDSGTDLAVLRVEGADLPAVTVGDANELRVGHLVVAVARPGETGLSATFGPISVVGGPWRTWSGGQIDRLVRPDLTLYPGFSGGPLIDAQGRVVGINTSGLSRGMGLAIPAATVNRVTEQLLTRGHISRGYVGLGMQPVRLNDALKNSLNITRDSGLIVVSVEPGGPAEKAGVLVGDIVIDMGGAAVADTRDVQSVLDPDRVGKSLNVQVIRGGQLQQLDLTVGERPARGE